MPDGTASVSVIAPPFRAATQRNRRRGPRDRWGRKRRGSAIESGQFSLDPHDQALIDPVEGDHVALDASTNVETASGGAWLTAESPRLRVTIKGQRDIAESSRLSSSGRVSRGRLVRNFNGTWRAKGQRRSFDRCPVWLWPIGRPNRRTRFATASVTPSWRRWRVCRRPASPGRP